MRSPEALTMAGDERPDTMGDILSDQRHWLRGFIAKRVTDTHAIDDILQDVFLKASENLRSLKSHGSVAAWLHRIATNAITDHYRSLRPWEELPEDLAAPEVERDYIRELATCLHPMIETMPTLYREALLLSEIEGLPQKEVARRMNISLSGAKSRVQRGRAMLREQVLDCCDVETGRNEIVGYTVRNKDRNCGLTDQIVASFLLHHRL